MTIKLEVGKTYELNNGKISKCVQMQGDDPTKVDAIGYGPFVIDGLLYNQGGQFGVGHVEILNVKKCVDGPTVWENMTDEDKGALLLAHHEGEDIERCYHSYGNWIKVQDPMFSPKSAYRIKPKPKMGKVVLYGACFGKGESASWRFLQEGLCGDMSHFITFNTIDGEPDPKTIKMAKLALRVQA